MAACSVKTSVQTVLHCFVLKTQDVQERVDVELGAGAYGRVFEVQYAGKCCAAKEIHSLFFSILQPKELEKIKRNFLNECRIWSTLNWPNIVTLIGVYFRDDDRTGMPLMVMEKMECSLRSLVEKQDDAAMKIDLRLKLSILHDVAGGLWHLHNQVPPIVHRDLTPNNILLRRGTQGEGHCFEAKISDLGVSKVLENTCKMTKTPGTPDFMPPETFLDNPKYGTPVDIFSYAGVVLYTIVEEWPTPTAREKVTNQVTEIVSEVTRRQQYLIKMNKFEELKSLVISCLNDHPGCRPAISEVSAMIEVVSDNYPTITEQNCPPLQIEDQELDDDRKAESLADESHGFEVIDMDSVLMQEMNDNDSTKTFDHDLQVSNKFKDQNPFEELYKTEQLKLTMKDALLIQCNLPEDLQKVEPEMLPYVTLSKIMTCEYENGLCCYDKSSTSSVSWDAGNGNDDDNDSTIHPIDNLLFLIHCSDNILRQNLMLKLSLCQVAIPLLLPDFSNGTVTFLLWAMQSIVKKWGYTESSIVDLPSPVVSFLRIGSVPLSKSKILNHVIGNLDFFFYKGCKGVDCKKKLAQGLVDLCFYLPCSSTDTFSNNPILFLNLHGDARKSKKQVKFIQKLSILSFVFIKGKEMNESAMQQIKYLAKSNEKTIVFIEKPYSCQFYSHSNIEICEFVVTLELENKIQRYIQETITKTIKNNKKTSTTLRQNSKIAKHCGIIIDEDNIDCQKAYKKANEIFKRLTEYFPMEAKLKSFPLQGPDCWQSWTKIDRKQYEEIGKQTCDLEKYNAERDAQKMKIRKKMEYYCKNLTAPVSTFLNVLLKYSDSIKHYFLSWLKILLDKYNRTVYDQLYKKNYPAEDINSAKIGLEHFFREMGQIYETVKGQEKSSKYPSIMAKLMVDGYCAELMDGDTAHVAVEWISAVFKELHIICNPANFFTLSVIGVQSTGKSTLLNTMFGLNLDTSAGKCTHGVIMRLLSFHKDAKVESKCNYLLLIDTEGLRSSPLSCINNKHDNELATFVVGLADIAMINITGESIDNLKELLQMVSHGLIRIKNIEINPSCKFVHNQITEPGAEIKITHERKDFLRFLDKCVHQACELEYCVGKYKSFSELMKFNENRDILCLKPLWNGNPPMAKVNLEYAKHVQEFKMSLINHTAQHNILHCSFVNFSIKINTLWNAVLREQFLFSFKTILEIIVRKEYYQRLSEWDTEFRLCYLDWESKAKVSFRTNESQDPNEEKEILLKEFEEILIEALNTIMGKKDRYFNESEYTEILKQWDTKTNEKINEYFQEYMKQAKYTITLLFIEHIREIKVQDMIRTFHAKVNVLVDDLFSSSLDEWLSDEILEEKFNKEWSAWLESTPSIDHEYRSPKQIEQQILQILQKHITMDMNLITQKLVKNPLTEWNTTFKMNIKVHFHIVNSLIGESDVLNVAEPLTCKWLNDFEFTDETDYSFHSVLHQFDQRVGELIRMIEKQNIAYHLVFQFTKEFICDIALTVSKQVEIFLISSEEKARKNDVKHELEKKKNDFFQILYVLYNNKKEQTDIIGIRMQGIDEHRESLEADRLLDSHTNVIECLCSIIGKAITRRLKKSLKYEINKDITVFNPIFKSKENFKLSVLKVLLEKKCFDEYKLYFTNPRQSYKKWVEYFVNEHCLAKFCKLRESKLQYLLESMQMSIITTNIDSGNLSFSFWMTEFYANIHTSDDVFLSEHDIQSISKVTIPWKSLEDVKAFKHRFLKCIIPTLVKEDSLTMYDGMKDELNNYMWKNLKKTILGCTECCPFCKEMCDAQDVCDKNDKHFIKLHRPKCLAKVLHHPSRNIVVDICTTSVGSNSKFRNADTRWNWKPYKQYQSLYPNWFISNTIEEAQPYWKYVIAYFRDDIAKWCGFGKTASVPEEWDEILEDIDSVKVSLSLSQY